MIVDNNGRREIVLDLWGDYALFTRSEHKVERMTYEVPTPSALRGILEAVYCKPVEFYYMITKIEVMNPVRTMAVMRNEVKLKADAKKPQKSLDVEKERTQRHSVVLRDVYYRIHARMIPQPAYLKIDPLAENKIYEQFEKRLDRGKCFYQPYFGSKEFICYFDEPDESRQPVSESRDLGIMLYDTFDIAKTEPLVTSNTKKNTMKGAFSPSYFHGYMINGIVNVPDFDSREVFKGE